MKIELMDCEEKILEEIADKNFHCDDVALTYAFCRDSCEKIDWKKVNVAIMNRWSLPALGYIKNEAAKLMDEKYGIKKEV